MTMPKNEVTFTDPIASGIHDMKNSQMLQLRSIESIAEKCKSSGHGQLVDGPIRLNAKLLALLAGVVLFGAAHAQQWVFQAGKQTNNGSVTVRSVDGSSSQAATQNPTGAAAKVNQTAVTQPPVVIMQATARLPVVVEGTACNSATDQLAVTAGNAKNLLCQGNVWKGAGGGLGDGQSWVDVTASRCNNCVHTNNTGRAIMVQAMNTGTNSAVGAYMYVNGGLVFFDYKHAPVARWWGTTVVGVVPANATYQVYIDAGISRWMELR